MSDHQQYEILCALAATNQIEEGDWHRLKTHLIGCGECGRALRESRRNGLSIVFSELADNYRGAAVPDGMIDRIAARLRSEGVALPLDSSSVGRAARRPVPRDWGRKLLWSSGASIVLLLAGSIGWIVSRQGSPTNDVQNTVAGPSKPSAVSSSSGNDRLNRELAMAEDRERISLGRLKAYQEQLVSASEREKGLTARIAALEASGRDLREKEDHSAELIQARQQVAQLRTQLEAAHNAASREELSKLDGEITRLKQELQKAEEHESASRAASLVTETELRSLRDRVERQGVQLNEQRQLNLAEHSARDLLKARSLHVQEIHGWDENGKHTPAFGRVFFAEGQKLEFYAYDLGTPNGSDTKVAYYLWADIPRTVKSSSSPNVCLGKFNLDSATENRWVLIVTDPQLLNRLSSIFVTVESGEATVKQPTGKRILSAFLNGKANHP